MALPYYSCSWCRRAIWYSTILDLLCFPQRSSKFGRGNAKAYSRLAAAKACQARSRPTGGVQLVLGVNTDDAVDNKLGGIGTEAKRWSDDNNYGIAKAFTLEGQQRLRVGLEEGRDVGDFKVRFAEEYPGLREVDRDGLTVDFAYDDEQIRRIKQSSIEQAERVIRNRVDKWGVAEPIINRRVADNSVLVQLPGFKDPSKAKELLGRTAQLRFKLVDDEFAGFNAITEANLPEGIAQTDNGGQTAFVSEDREALETFVAPLIPADKQMFLEREDLAGGRKARFTTYVVDASTEIQGDDVLDAFVAEDATGLDRQPVVSLKFTGPGGKRFGDVTGENIGRRLAIVLDNTIVSAPNIQSKIATGSGQITLGNAGGYNERYEEANELALILKSGALPATIEVLEERQVGASLGPELADQGVKGVLVGLALVLIYMVIYYRKPGMLACGALILNGVFLLALMAAFGFSLTLPGIAGFILTLGMAVDANVLINERIRQELREGRHAKKAVENGFGKVFWTIIDANVTTLIAALVLLETNSSGPIRGFAITLMLGLIVSMFTSLYCSKAFFMAVVAKQSSEASLREWLGGKKAVKDRTFGFDFLKFGKTAAMVSIAIALAVIAGGAIKGLNWGVDFAGGTEIMLGFDEDTDANEIKAVAKDAGIGGVTLQALEGGKRQYLLRFGGGEESLARDQSEEAADEAAMVQSFRENLMTTLAARQPEILQVDFVGPQIGRELRTQGVMSVVYAIIGVLLYIAFRFDMRFGPGAVVKMVQDVFVIMAFYVFFQRSFDLTTVAAFLTVVGYSVNDTIVIYDRIRENMALHPKTPLPKVINNSLNETLARTINTSVTTMLALFGILLFASGQIWNFAAALFIGVIAATLSSQFLASSFVLWLEHWRKNRPKKATPTRRPAGASV